jgi:Putative zinc-finger
VPPPSAHWQRDLVITLPCRAVAELATGYLDQDLDPDHHRRVVAHLASCDGCQRYLDQVRTSDRSWRRVVPAWGGYIGYFTDPFGNLWKSSYANQAEDRCHRFAER